MTRKTKSRNKKTKSRNKKTKSRTGKDKTVLRQGQERAKLRSKTRVFCVPCRVRLDSSLDGPHRFPDPLRFLVRWSP